MLLEIDHITKAFGGVIATNDVTASVEEGKIFSIIGPNGAGKTTLFNLITGAYTRTSGTITFGGKKIDTLTPPEINKLGIARTFQNIRLFKQMSVLENVMTGMHSRIQAKTIESFIPIRSRKIEKEIVEKSMEALRIVGLADKYDESAAGMNINESTELLSLIRWINSDLHKTIVFIEHNMRVVMNVSDYIIVLDHGTKIAEGVPEVVSKDRLRFPSSAWLWSRRAGAFTPE